MVTSEFKILCEKLKKRNILEKFQLSINEVDKLIPIEKDENGDLVDRDKTLKRFARYMQNIALGISNKKEVQTIACKELNSDGNTITKYEGKVIRVFFTEDRKLMFRIKAKKEMHEENFIDIVQNYDFDSIDGKLNQPYYEASSIFDKILKDYLKTTLTHNLFFADVLEENSEYIEKCFKKNVLDTTSIDLSAYDVDWLANNMVRIEAHVPDKQIKMFQKYFPNSPVYKNSGDAWKVYFRIVLKNPSEWTEDIPDTFLHLLNSKNHPTYNAKLHSIENTLLVSKLVSDDERFNFSDKNFKNNDDSVFGFDFDIKNNDTHSTDIHTLAEFKKIHNKCLAKNR